MDATDYFGFAPDMGCYEYGIATSVNISGSIDLSIFPNPTNGILNIDFADQKIRRFVISDLQGKAVIEKTNEVKTQRLDLSGLESGVYIITFGTESGTFTNKIVKQ